MRELNEHSSTPLYHQLRQLIREEIEVGKWERGDQIPTEQELGNKFNISQTTVRQAINALVNEGLLRRKRGQGTYVTNTRIRQGPNDLTSFSDEMLEKGYEPSSKVLNTTKVKSDKRISNILELEGKEEIFKIERLRLADGSPMGIQKAHLPATHFPDLLEKDLSGSLYKILSEEYGIVPAFASENYRATLLDEHEMELLKAPQDPFMGFIVERKTYSKRESPIEFVESIMRGDRYEVSVDLSRKEFKREGALR